MSHGWLLLRSGLCFKFHQLKMLQYGIFWCLFSISDLSCLFLTQSSISQLKLVDVHSAEWEFAKLALFSKHPEMESRFYIVFILLAISSRSWLLYNKGKLRLIYFSGVAFAICGCRLARRPQVSNIQIGHREYISGWLVWWCQAYLSSSVPWL